MLSDNISRDPGGVLCFAGQRVDELAEKYGTPLYLMDEDRIRRNCRMYRSSFAECFGEGSLALYAGKAASFKQMIRIVSEEGLGLDAVSVGEIHTALCAHFPPENIWFHGDGKTDEDIRYAVSSGIGHFVVDNESELSCIAQHAKALNRRQKVLLRLTPGIDPHTYEAVNTGKVDVKFGVPIETGQALEFVRKALEEESLEVEGLHCHVGSMVFDETVFEDTADIMFRFMALLRRELGYTAGVLDLGGGYGVRYLESDRTVDIPARIRALAAHIKRLSAALDVPVPKILMEPGRSIVADAGMTIYTVSTVKHIPGFKSYAIVDGGMSDNPRYCLYGAAYTVLPVMKTDAPEARFDLVGRCCESGDVIQPKILLPSGIRRGDLVAVCTTGAYHYSMASNYNRLGRPPVVMLRGGESYVAVRRETPEDLCALDV